MDIPQNLSLDRTVIVRTSPEEVVSKEKEVVSKAPVNAVCFFSPIKAEQMFESAVVTHVIFLAPLDRGKFWKPTCR